mmetsp:Transcript_10601/g.25796  ORF Transcript_10601/g.25796 Transcript_10601/m.25796 type:complete len:373 (+) Transcript_10601:59-1177(+)
MAGAAQPGGGVTEEIRERAAWLVLKTWRCFRDRRVFQYLRHAVCRAEDSLTHQVLRRINPIEAMILRDPTLNARLRFRFAGADFPPVILYKVFIHANVQYVSGSSKILPGSKAANDAHDQMGDRKFIEIVLADIENCTPLSAASLKDPGLGIQDRLHEHATLDSLPMWLGGRANPWRVLVDTSYSINEHALRFLPSAAEATGKDLKILDAILSSLESKILASHAAGVPMSTPAKFATRDALERVRTSQQRARSRGMHRLYSSAIREKAAEVGVAEDDGMVQVMSHGGGTQRMRVLEEGEELLPGVQHTQVLEHDVSLGDDDILEKGMDLADWASKLSFENYYESWVPPPLEAGRGLYLKSTSGGVKPLLEGV